MLRSIRLIQIGDVHYPEAKADGSHIDYKDHALSEGLVQASAPLPKLQSVLRKVCQLCDKPDFVHALLLCGDLTTRGDLAGYQECVAHFNRCLSLADPHRWPPDHIHAVPGNHDVDRQLCDPGGKDLYKKFLPLLAAWDALSLPILAANNVRQTRIEYGRCAVEALSINSCIGCGESRYLPERIKDELHALLSPLLDPSASRSEFNLVAEQLDTPAFVENDVDRLVQQLKELDGRVLPVVLTHHNLLPQPRLRIQIYTEVLNAGLVRARLSRTDRPVIYAHGHVHDHLVEVVRQPQASRGRLVIVSAPLFINGFNLIEISFGREALPVGCTIVPFRLHPDGEVVEEHPVQVPLHDPLHPSQHADELLKNVVNATDGNYERFRDILATVRTNTGTRHPKLVVADALAEASWLGHVKILDRELEADDWQVRRIMP